MMSGPGKMDADDDLVRIEPGGRVEPVGPTAALRLQAREGTFRILPAPPELVLLRQASSATGPSRRCLLSGEIVGPGSLCDIFGFVAQVSWNGELVVFDDVGTRSLFIEDGHVVGASSTVAQERLGQVLYRYGLLDEGQVTQALTTAGTTMRVGEAAVKLGFLRREKLFELMGRQAEEIFRGALAAENGAYYFLDAFDEQSLASRQMLPLSSLLREGVRWMHEVRYFRARIPSSLHVPVATGAHPPRDPAALAVFERIDGRRSVADIVRLLGESELVVTRALFQLLHHGAVTMRPPRLAAEQAMRVCNDAVGLILRELDALDEGDAVRAQLAEFAASGVYARLFAGQKPADDGAYDPDAFAANLVRLGDPALTAEQLTTWLCEYVGYALFLSRPHVQRSRSARTSRPDQSPEPRLSQRVAAMLEPIRNPTKAGGNVGGR